MEDKILVIRAEEGKILEEQIVEGDITKVVKEIAEKALKLWDPASSDYVVVKDKYEVKLPLPLTKEQFEKYSRYGLRRSSEHAVFYVPVYMISYDSEWRGDNYIDRAMYLVTVYVDDAVKNEIIAFAEESTSQSG